MPTGGSLVRRLAKTEHVEDAAEPIAQAIGEATTKTGEGLQPPGRAGETAVGAAYQR